MPDPRRVRKWQRAGEGLTRGSANPDPMKRTLTLAEAALATGLSAKALQRRIDRGSLQSVLQDGRRLIPSSELLRLGLLTLDDPGAGQERVRTGEAPAAGPRVSDAVSLLDLVDRIERQALEIGELRALTRETESTRLRLQQEADRADRLTAELMEARARILALEAKKRRSIFRRAA